MLLLIVRVFYILDDLFPYKFEINEILKNYAKRRFGDEAMIKMNFPRLNQYLFASYLMYMQYEDKDGLVQELTKNNMKHYLIHSNTKEQLEYLQSITTLIITRNMFESDEIALLDLAGVHYEKDVMDDEVHKFIHDSVKPQFKHFKAMLANRKSFIYWLSVINSRSYKLTESNYENIKNYKVEEFSLSNQNYSITKELSSQDYNIALIPFFDICNHEPKNKKGTGEFLLNYSENIVNIGVDRDFNVGDEYSYNYSPRINNEKLVFNYGFYMNNNEHQMTFVKYVFEKPKINREKHEILVKAKLIEVPFDNFFSTSHQKIGLVGVVTTVFNPNFYNQLRIYHTEDKNLRENVTKMFNNPWVDYDLELKALSHYKNSIIVGNINPATLTLPDISRSIFETEHYYNSQNESFKNLSEKYKFISRKNIMLLAKETTSLYLNNSIFADEKINEIVSDQLKKLKDYYLN